ncbi:unnamed protein product [Bursaphelenchus xylophilus]|uniref:(pine wood nematode) hypothetical protein n=1 Tax=Bursaphelenchus xylophilus TaxID=6326 RepID=A0A1I7S1R4_BURXY|nr:unnamed protein product [Bursaphelenchus xylophilus]CAG9089835.1 unnamed protein product [Bursaphelenchus xylophilus]
MISLQVVVLSAIFMPVNSETDCGTTCQTYPCLEKRAQCGPDGYLIGYGERNCENFIDPELYSNFNAKGKAFINCTMVCLTQYLEEYFSNRTTIDCDQLTNDAFQSHVQCYLGCGFCHVWFSNLIAFSKVFNVSDFLTKRAFKTVTKTAVGCLG